MHIDAFALTLSSLMQLHKPLQWGHDKQADRDRCSRLGAPDEGAARGAGGDRAGLEGGSLAAAVERRACVDDGRGQLIGITDRGRAIRRKMWPIYARAIQSAVGEHLSAAQADALDALLGRLIAANEDS